MTNHPNPGEKWDQVSAVRAKAEICDRFEAAWRAGGRPQIEQHLRDLPEVERKNLLVELLALELAIRRDRKEQPPPDEYCQRFPDAVTLVREAFHQAKASEWETFRGGPGVPETFPTWETAVEGPDAPSASPEPSGVSNPGEKWDRAAAQLR